MAESALSSLTISSNESTIDRISVLPDSVLCHILSFFPTKEAVATSVLSKRWQNLWTCVPKLDINSAEIGENFEQVISKIILSRNPSCEIRVFRLQCSFQHVNAKLYSFLENTISRHVQEIDLTVHSTYDDFKIFEPPFSIYSCKTLVKLKLRSDIFLDIFCPTSLPSLKLLHLSRVRYLDDSSFRNLISGCPVLQVLLLEMSTFDSVMRYDISSPTLRKLFLDCSFLDSGLPNMRKSVTINAPGLEILILTEHFRFPPTKSDNSNVTDLLQLFRFPIEWDAVFSIVKILPNIKSLLLGSVMMKAFQQHDKLFEKLPKFHNLVDLTVHNFCGFWGVLKLLLRHSPQLKHFNMVKNCRCDSADHPPELHCWIAPPQVPNCLTCHLISVRFLGFEGSEAEMEFTRYVLKNSMVLKEVLISTSESCCLESEVLRQELSTLPMGSTACQFIVE